MIWYSRCGHVRFASAPGLGVGLALQQSHYQSCLCCVLSRALACRVVAARFGRYSCGAFVPERASQEDRQPDVWTSTESFSVARSLVG